MKAPRSSFSRYRRAQGERTEFILPLPCSVVEAVQTGTIYFRTVPEADKITTRITVQYIPEDSSCIDIPYGHRGYYDEPANPHWNPRGSEARDPSILRKDMHWSIYIWRLTDYCHLKELLVFVHLFEAFL